MLGQLSSDSGLALVVPGYFVCAGILFYTGITAGIVGLYRQRVPLYITFAAVCLLSALFSVGIASYHLADSINGAVEAMRWSSAAAIAFLLALFVFIGTYTEASGMGRAYAVATTVTAVLLAANALMPLGIRYDSIESFSWVHMPWGESLFRIEGRVSVWNMVLRLLTVLLLVWSVRRLLALNRLGKRRDAVVLAVYVIGLFAASVHGALLDTGLVKGIHLLPIAFVGLALLMGVSLVTRIGEYNRILKATAAELRVENERRRAAEEHLRERAFTDALTGLPNRLFVQERLASMIELGAEGSFGAVLCCDLDHFKVVNEALSHEVGDELLRVVASRLKVVGNGEALVARLGGDQFLVVLEALCASEAEAHARIGNLAEDLVHALGRTAVLGERSLNLSASIGIATFPARAITPTEVIGRVEMALHRAKKRGRNNIQAFVPALQRESAERFRVVEGLRNAVAGGELALHYQPQVDLGGRVIGAEALMRWSSPAMGPVSPATFIPVAEESGLIHALGEWSLRTGCERLAAWKRDGVAFDGHLSINVSPWQLARHEFVDRLVRLIEETGVDPRCLTLEITESAVLFDVNETVAKLRDIRPLGVRIALDDFGTGYSSLALIKDLPLDAIKIDQSFVRHIDEGANKHLIRVVVAIGSALGLEIIAEGVETAAERDVLAALGCTHLQGYLYARPMPEKQFVEWLASRHAARPVAETLSF